MKKIALLPVLLILASCFSKQTPPGPSHAFQPPRRVSTLTDKTLEEVSGLAASITNPGYLWAHNDSNSGPEVFLIDTALNVRLTCVLKNIENRDWEDIAVGPGPNPAKNYIYVGEIGDNLARHTYKYIYRFEEPVLRSGQTRLEIIDFTTLCFRLEDKKKDAETLLLDPATKDLYVITKREEPVHVYQLKYPYDGGDTLVARNVAALPLTQLVAGDILNAGGEILLKNYKKIYYWPNEAHLPPVSALAELPQEIPYEEEPQGEAIAWRRDGRGFYTLSETKGRKKTYLYFYARK
jgi:hypothetical protein